MQSHPLEYNEAEQRYFMNTLKESSHTGRSAYRRAVEALTGSLPTWAIRGKPGRKPGKRSTPPAEQAQS